jgi:hypothetical protein
MRYRLIEAYIDFINNYLTVEKWAEHNGLTPEQGLVYMDLAREVYYSEHPDA